MTLYRHIPVYRRIEGGVSLYHVFEMSDAATRCSRDFHYPDSTNAHRMQLDAQLLELLTEEAPEVRSGLFATIESAVDAFDAKFADEAESCEA